jgi:hypothetical protein
MNLLKNERFVLKFEWVDDTSAGIFWENVRNYEFKDFNYDEDKKILSFRSILVSMHNTRGSIVENSYFSNVMDYKIDLCSASPLVRIADYDADRVQVPAKVVSLNAMTSFREVSVNEYGINESLIDTKTFGGFKKGGASFNVSPDVAPRLKTALEDLLKAHNVKVTKY